MEELETTLRHSHDWVLDRINQLCAEKQYDDAYALKREFNEWLNPRIHEHDIYSMKYLKKNNQ